MKALGLLLLIGSLALAGCAGETDESPAPDEETTSSSSDAVMATLVSGGSASSSGICYDELVVPYNNGEKLNECCIRSGRYGTYQRNERNTRMLVCTI